MGGGAVFSEVEIPPVGVAVEVVVFDFFFEDVEFVFALGAADEFADAGDEDVHGSAGFTVVVGVHVEGFDLLGVVGEDDGAADVFFGEPTFVF